MTDFRNRVALVTGAGRGLGFAYAKALAAYGATVIVQDSGSSSDGEGVDPRIAEAAAQKITGAGGMAFAASGPLTSQTNARALVDGVLAEHRRLDIVIHNAGFVGYQTIEDLEPAFLDRMMRLSVDASLWLAQAAWPTMREAKFGRILFTTSDRAIYPQYAQEGLIAYAAAKLATIGIANVLALEGAPYNITANAISPVAKTRMWGVEDEPDELTPDAVAPGALYLVSSDCTQGGWVLRAANGQFVATRAREAEDVDYPRDLAGIAAETVEAVATAWSDIAVDLPEARKPASGQPTVTTAFDSIATLGECPVWSDRKRCLFWVDAEARTLNRFDPTTGRSHALGMPDVVGMVAERDDGAVVVALGCDLATVDDDGTLRRLATAPDGGEAFRLNDGRYDAEGRLWIGLMHKELQQGSGVLYRYDPDGSWHVMDRGFTLINGLDWSPDRCALYVTDSRAPAIYAYRHDPAFGTVEKRQTFASFGPDDGFPDGLLVGPDGAMWSTLFGGAAIQRIEPDGRFSRRIALPVSRPTSCAFSGDGRSLYVTTARLGLVPEALNREPLAGAILKVEGIA